MPYLRRVTISSSSVQTGLSALDVTLAHGERTAVHEAAIRLQPGRVTALIGPNGSGKSTLLRALARLHRPVSGTVAFTDGAELSSLASKELARRISLLTQNRPPLDGVSVREVVEYGRHPHRGRWRAGDENGAFIVERAMAVTGVQEFADRAVDALSGGQLQRVWLASCLAQDTAVLLLDEPTTYLDLRYQVEILDLVRDLADVHGVAVGIVLHDLDSAAAVADDVVLLCDGRVVANGSPHEVFTAERLGLAYGIPVAVDHDVETGLLRTRALGRHSSRRSPVLSEQSSR